MSPDGRCRGTRAALAALLALGGACGASSNAEVKPDGAAGNRGAAGATASGGAGGAGGVEDCAARAAYAEASHLIANVTWPAGLASMGGTGQLHVWGKASFTVAGNTLSGTLQACGIALPPTSLTALGGGGMVQIDVPAPAWDAPSMPRFPIDGTQSGWNVGSKVSYSYAALVGYTMVDGATAAWPSSYTGIGMTDDAEGDANPGLTALPRSGGGYTLPPTSILQIARADQLYIVVRQVTAAALTRTTCDQASGTATLMHLDNHVIGCHVSGGEACSSTEINFIDQNRTIYAITGATAETTVVADTASCADVRAALPM
jgi:hypothetical protein